MLNDYGLQFKEIDTFNYEIYDERAIKVFSFEYVPDYFLAISTWTDFTTVEQIMGIYKHIGWFAFQNKLLVMRSISDLSQFDGSFADAADWFFDEYIPIAVQAGLQASASIEPKDFYAQLAMDEIIAKAKHIKHYKWFPTFQEGYDWVISLELDSPQSTPSSS